MIEIVMLQEPSISLKRCRWRSPLLLQPWLAAGGEPAHPALNGGRDL